MAQRAEDLRMAFKKHYLNPDVIDAEVRRRTRQGTVSDMKGELYRLTKSSASASPSNDGGSFLSLLMGCDDDHGWDGLMLAGQSSLPDPGSFDTRSSTKFDVLPAHPLAVAAGQTGNTSPAMPSLGMSSARHGSADGDPVVVTTSTLTCISRHGGDNITHPSMPPLSASGASSSEISRDCDRTVQHIAIAPAAEPHESSANVDNSNPPSNSSPCTTPSIPTAPHKRIVTNGLARITTPATASATENWTLPGPKCGSPVRTLSPFCLHGYAYPPTTPLALPPAALTHQRYHRSGRVRSPSPYHYQHDDVSELMKEFIRAEQLDTPYDYYSSSHNGVGLSNHNPYNLAALNGLLDHHGKATIHTTSPNPFGGLPAVTNPADLAAAFSYFWASGYIPSNLASVHSVQGSNNRSRSSLSPGSLRRETSDVLGRAGPERDFTPAAV
ncbi:hypothetical protein SeLEV6574_g03620 [Synchytrium endobioticum]|nr:hypothetical protein SeLEV6574_g03620 [Synchytrium endobioticum]